MSENTGSFGEFVSNNHGVDLSANDSFGEFLDNYDPTPKPKGGFINAATNVAGSTLSGTGHVLKDIGLEAVGNSAIAKGKEIQDNNPAAVNSLSDIAKNPGTWVAESAGGMAGQAGEALAGGLIGGYVGGGLGALTGPLAPIAIPALSAAGAYVGGNIPMLVQEYGSERDQQSKNGIDDKKRALAGAAATTVIENLGGFKPGGMAGQGKKIVSDLAGKTTKEAAKTLVKKGIKSGVSEGLEEIPQQYTGAYGGGTDIKDLNTAENAQDAAFGAAMAFPGGAMFGSVNTISDHYKAKRNEALDQTASTGPLGNALASGGLANTDTFNPVDGSIIDSTAVDIAANSNISSYDNLSQQTDSNSDNTLDLRTDAEKAQDNASVIDSVPVNTNGLQGTHTTADAENNAVNTDLSILPENQNGSQKTDESTNETSAQEKGPLLNTDAPEQSGVTPNIDALAEQLHTAIATDNSKQPDQHYADIVASNKLTPQQSDDLITKYQGIAEQVNNEQTNQQTEAQAQDQTGADQGTKLNFQPTHTLEDGTPVVASATQDGAYYDESGNGRLSWDAKPIGKVDTAATDTGTEGQGNNTGSNLPSYATAPLLNKRTNKPFKTRKMAEAAIASSSNPTLNKQDHIPVPVDGGFGIAPKPNTTQENNDTATETQSVLSNTITNATGVTASTPNDVAGQASNATAQEVASQNTKAELPQKLYETPVKSLGASVKDFVQSKVSEATTFTESNGKFYIGGTTGAGLKQVTKAVHTYGKAYQKHLTAAYDAQDKVDAIAQATETVAQAQEFGNLSNNDQANNESSIFGYSFDEIKNAQQGGSLNKPVVSTQLQMATEADIKLLNDIGLDGLKEKQMFGVIDKLQNSNLIEKPTEQVANKLGTSNDQAKIPQVAQPTLMKRNVELHTVNGTVVKGDRYLFSGNERHPIIITKPSGNKGAATKQNHVAWDEISGSAIYMEPPKVYKDKPSAQHVIDVVSNLFNSGFGNKLDGHDSRIQIKAPIQESANKQPWELTKKEYGDIAAKRVSGQSAGKARKMANTWHAMQIRKAVAENKPIPQEVLADYPDLKAAVQETANPINDNADVSKKGENVDTYHQQTIDEFLSDAKKELGADFDGLKPSLINEHYQSIEDHIKDGGKISQAVYDSLETGKQHHFNKTFGAENVIDDGTRQAELDKLNKISDSKLAKDNEVKAQEEKEFADKKKAVAIHQADETVRMAQYDVDHYGASESNQLKLDQAIKSRDALGRADNTTATKKLTTKGTVVADKAENNIQDFGEKLEGAKKFTYTFKEALSEDIDISAVPLSKSFPQPDYDKLIAGGIEPQVAALIAQLRAEIPTKPSKSYRVSKWVAQVTAIREAADSLLSGDLTVEQFIKIGKGTDNYTKYMGDVLAIANSILPSQIRELGNFKLDHTLYGLHSGVKDVWKWSVVNTASKSSWGKQFDSKEEAIAYIKSEISTENTKGESIAKFDRWTERGKPGVVFVGKKIASGKYITLKEFPTSKEALNYTIEHNAELVELLKQKKKDKEIRRAENNQRVGKDYRNGKNVSAKEFTDTFGFRGVQFGNWVENDRRQQDLNNAYDGLIDLAEVLGIPPKALALNGELGLAFGARGTGGEKAAAAHYEPNQVVINLTKAHGAGSLAHEWWHAVDNYFGKQEGSGFLSDKGPRRAQILDGNKYRASTDSDFAVRKEVFDAWQGITKAIKTETQLAKRSAIKDKTRSKDYYSTVIEMTARTFERYIIGKLADQGYENDYLANIIPAPILEKENELDNEDYAYPLQSEMAAVNKAYDKLFDTLETKETDKGTILFSRSKSTKDRYEQRIDELFSGDKPNQESDIAVLDSSDVLSMLGYAKEKIYLVEKKVILSTKEENHNMTADLWKKIPEWLENPVAVFDSETEKGRLVFVAPETLNGDPIFMIVEPNAMRGRTKVYLLINGYDRSSDKIPSARWIRDEKLRYIDNSKSRAISAASRLQLPAREQQNKPGSRVKILTEKNLVKYRQQNNTLNSISTNPVVNPHSKTSLNQAVTKAMDSLFGQGWTNRLMATGKFKVISRDEAVQIAGSTAANAKGFFNSDTDITYLVYDNIEQDASSKALVGLMLHEISTHSLNLGKSSEAFQDILRRFEALKATNPKVQAAFANVPASTPDEHKVEEALAEYLAENPKSSLAQRIVEWFRQAVRALGKTLPVLERAKFSQWANKLTEAELIGMATSALKSAPDSLQFDNVGRNREGIKFVKIPQSDIKLGQKVNDPVKVSGDPNLWVIPEEVTVRTKGRFTSKPIRLLMGKHFGKNHGFGLTHIEAGHAKEIAETGMTTEQWVISVIKSATKIFDNGSDRLIIYSAKAPKGAAFIELRNDGDFYSVITAYNTEPKGKIVWSGRRHLISSEGSNVSGTQGTVATTTGLPINPTVRTDTIAGKSSAQSRETLTDQTTDETISQQENNSSNNIKFSRSTPRNTPADNSTMRSFFAPAKGKQALGWLAGLFQRNHLIDFVAKDLPELINYKLLSQEKDNFTNQRENEIGKSYKEMMDKMDKKTMHELGRVQGMATRLVKFDPALADDNTPMTEEELAVYDAYTALPIAAKEVYATMRDAYQTDLMEKKRALIERIKAFPADRETQAEIIRTIENHFDQFKEGVYFPLNRDGAVIVRATNVEGELVIEHVATQANAYKLIKEMQDQGYENTHILGKDAYDRDLLAGNAANEMAALAHRTISDLKEKSVQGKLTDADFNDLFSEFNQLLINTLPDSSYRKHFIHRKGTLGESTDTLRAYAKTRTSAVKMIASLTYDHQIQAVLNDADKTIKEMDKVPGSDTLAIKSILNELKLREAALKSTEINAMSQVLTSLGFMGALGFNIGSAAVNMLQVMGVALPELSGRHGEVEAMKEIASAYKLLFNPATLNRSSGFDVTKNPNINDITRQAIERLKQIGKIDLTMTHDSIAAGKNPSYSSNLMTRSLGSAAKYSGYFFHVAEAANRQITGMAAFNLAYQKNGGNFEAAIAEAVDVIDRTQFDYGQGNRARYMMSNTARVLTLFKAYALGMSYYIGRNAYQSMKGETPEVRLQARKTLVVSMAMSFATAGLFGMPIGIEAFAGIGGVAAFKYKGANFAVPGAIGGMLIFQALLAGLGADDEDDLETEFRNWLTDNFDQTTAEWVTKGPARLLPIGDISGRTSLSELWWRSQNKQLEGTDQYNAIATALIGPIGSQIAGLFTAKKMYEDGQYSRMVESMSPAFMRNAIAATRMSQDGVRNLKGDKIIERDLTPVELINKVIGFNPTVVTNTYDANSAIAKESTKHTMAKSHLVNRWLSGNATERSDLMKGDIKDFNESVSPSERITLKNLFASMKARKGIDKHTQKGLYLSKKQNYLRDIGRFNRQE